MTHDAAVDPVADAEALDRLLATVADEHAIPALEDARRPLHGVIVALETAQRRVTELEAELADTRQQLDEAREANQIMREATARARAARPCGRSATHPPHKWMSDRRAVQCAGVGLYDETAGEART